MAIDINLFKAGNYLSINEDYRFLAEYWESLDERNVAGYFRGWDAMHFKMREYSRPKVNHVL